MLLKNNTVLGIIGAAAALALPAAGQQRQLSARELFYAPAATQKTEPAKPPAQAARKQEPKVAKRTRPPKPRPDEPAEQPAGQTGRSRIEADVVPAAETSAGFPLGLRYSLLKESSGQRYEEVDAETVFRSGDRIRLSIEANDRAYLYVVTRGSSGMWKVLFPSEEIEGGDNRVHAGQRRMLPPGGRWTFYNQPGEERLFIVLSRRPENDLEELIYSLRTDRPGTKPASQPAAPERPKQILLAQNSINDALVQRIRSQFVARDLMFEKVDESTPGERREKAVYIVNPSRDPDARLVVDLSLKHE